MKRLFKGSSIFDTYNIIKPRIIIGELNEHGYEAYLVGGCVRDAILNKVPKDWDITTNATPDEVIKIFSPKYKVLEVGKKYGTVAVVIDSNQYEITTYRVDGEYSDNRKPNNVEYTSDIVEDLKRRDFTMNAIAINPNPPLKIIDPFNGIDDIYNRTIRCVGNANERFEEDALRILRALRFSAKYGFDIESDTAIALTNNRYLLKNISAERINAELCKILMSDNCGNKVLRKYSSVIRQIIPEIGEMIDFPQNNPHHLYDVWEHTLHCMDYEVMRKLLYSPDIIVRLAVLLHDIGKPYCYSEDENKIGHFYGHAKISAEIAEDILTRLKFSNDIKDKVVELIINHDIQFLATKSNIKRTLNRLGEEQLRRLLSLREFDIWGQNRTNESWQTKNLKILSMYKILDFIIKENECFKLKDLDINGKDLIELGIPQGRQIGEILNALLIMVIDGEIENKKEKLIEVAKLLIKERK